MTTLLFPSTSSSKSSTIKKHYPVILGDIVRGASDSIDALELFASLLKGQNNDSSSVGFMAFDAHVGDTSCQLRAGMMREMFSYHQKLHSSSPYSDSEDPMWLIQMVMLLRMCRDAAQDTCFKMTRNKVRPVAIGLNAKTESCEKIAESLGWVEPELTMWEQPEFDEEDEQDSNNETNTWSSASSTVDSVFSTRASSPDFMAREDRRIRRSASNFSLASSSANSLDEDTQDQDSDSPKWNLLDGKTMIRFIVYSYVLSKYKNFSWENGVIGRLDARAAASFGEDLISPYNDKSNSEYAAISNPRRVEAEMHAMQVWLSELSCSWLHTLAHRSSYQGFDRLIRRTTRRAVTKHACVPAYLGFLLMREDLAMIGDTVILVDRHFCSHGHHSNIFLAKLTSENDDDYFGLPDSEITWSVEQAPVDYLTSVEDNTPRVVITGNSIDGSQADYQEASAPGSSRCNVHTDEECSENAAHIASFLAADHNKLSLAFMAAHKHYAFQLQDPKEAEAGENQVVYDIMEQEQSGLGERWQETKDQCAELGTGESLSIFSWQHIVLETKSRLAKMVSQRTDTLPLKANVSTVAKVDLPKLEAPKPKNRKERKKQQQTKKVNQQQQSGDNSAATSTSSSSVSSNLRCAAGMGLRVLAGAAFIAIISHL